MAKSKFTKFLKNAATAAVGAYAANKLSKERELWAFDCNNSKCGHYEERSGNHKFKSAKCPLCGWRIRGKKI